MFDKHLKTSKVTYIQHMRWAVVAGIRLIYAGFASIIHAMIPTLFDGVAPKIIIEIFCCHLRDHPNPSYQKMIADAEKKTSLRD